MEEGRGVTAKTAKRDRSDGRKDPGRDHRRVRIYGGRAGGSRQKPEKQSAGAGAGGTKEQGKAKQAGRKCREAGRNPESNPSLETDFSGSGFRYETDFSSKAGRMDPGDAGADSDPF